MFCKSVVNSCENALVTGGRTHNERYREYSLNLASDVDLASCYGTGLNSFTLPIGIPTVFAKSPNEDFITLRDFLHQYENELCPNLWKIVVSGKLSFEQDLIYSRTITPRGRENFYNNTTIFNGDFDELNHLNSNLVLLKKEIINGTITHDLVENIRKISSNNEMKSFLDLKVITAVFWKKSDQVHKLEDWCDFVLRDKKDLIYDVVNSGLSDKRCKKWFGYPLKNFINPLLEKRKHLKKQMKETGCTLKNGELNAQQLNVKLLVLRGFSV